MPKQKKYCTIIWQLTEMYRSGHNGTDSKSVDGVTRPWVRIPPSPPTARNTNPCGSYFFLFSFFKGIRTGWQAARNEKLILYGKRADQTTDGTVVCNPGVIASVRTLK